MDETGKVADGSPAASGDNFVIMVRDLHKTPCLYLDRTHVDPPILSASRRQLQKV